MELKHKLLALRLEKDIGQKEIASYLNVTIGTISNYENGVHCPDLSTLVRLADFFDVSLDYLAGRTDCRKNVTVLNRSLIPGFSVGELITSVTSLPQKDIHILLEQLELLELRNAADKLDKPKK